MYIAKASFHNALLLGMETDHEIMYVKSPNKLTVQLISAFVFATQCSESSFRRSPHGLKAFYRQMHYDTAVETGSYVRLLHRYIFSKQIRE